MLTVASLIELLKELPDKSLPVYIPGNNSGLYKAYRVQELRTKPVTNSKDSHDVLVDNYCCLRRDINGVVLS